MRELLAESLSPETQKRSPLIIHGKRQRGPAPSSGGCQNLPHQLREELASHRRHVGRVHHLPGHHCCGGLHPALLDRGQRQHPAGWILRPLPLLHRQCAHVRAHLQRQHPGLRLHPFPCLQDRHVLCGLLHAPGGGNHGLLQFVLLLQHWKRLQDLRMDAAGLR